MHHSAFEAGGVEGYADQAERVATGDRRDRGAGGQRGQAGGRGGRARGPGRVRPGVRERCVLVEALVVVDDPELHRGHFSHRPGTRPAERYLARFDEIRGLQDHLGARAGSRAWR